LINAGTLAFDPFAILDSTGTISLQPNSLIRVAGDELAPFQLIELHSAPASAALHDSELGGISQPLG
jgi:hypothetical protein